MSEETGVPIDDEKNWSNNYFNYFTEIEEHFQRARGTGLFLLSPLDWALIENWKNAGVPLEAVLKGIDDAFEKWRRRKTKRRNVNSVAYCSQAVLEAAQRTSSRDAQASGNSSGFSVAEIRAHLAQASESLRSRDEAPLREVADSLEGLMAKLEKQPLDLEQLERHLTAMEDKIGAALRTLHSDQSLYEIRLALDTELRPYRSTMSAEQLSMLERRYLETALWQRAGLPRLSLFYLHPI